MPIPSYFVKNPQPACATAILWKLSDAGTRSGPCWWRPAPSQGGQVYNDTRQTHFIPGKFFPGWVTEAEAIALAAEHGLPLETC
jgi:hypothetical protein